SNQVSDYLATKVELIESRSLAAVVVDDRNLTERAALLGDDIEQQRPPGMSDAEWLKAKKSRAAAMLSANVSASVPDISWVIPISYVSNDPVFAAEMANAYADAFMASDSRDTLAGNEYAIEYLSEQIEITRGKLAEAEQQTNNYARNSGIIVQPSMSAEGAVTSTTLTNSSLSNISQRYAEARAARIAAEQKWRAIEGLPAAQLPEVQNNPVLQGLVSDRTGKLTELSELRRRYNDEFPQIVDILAQIEVLDTQIGQTSADIKSTVRNAYDVALRQERALRSELDTLSGASLAEQDEMVQLTVFEREAEALRQQLRSLLDRYNQISSAANVNSGTMTAIDSALVPGQPFSPNILTNMGIAFVLGVAAAFGLAVLREMFDDRVRSLDDIEEKVGLPLLGHTPYVDERLIELESTNQFTALMEAYASLKASIEFSLPRNRNVLQLTSSNAAEGKSTTAVVLAELFARGGRKTLLVDADLRRPSVAKLLELDPSEKGLVEVLYGHANFEEAVNRGVHDNLDVLPLGKIPPNPSDILSSNELQEFINKYRDEYSLILFDSSPVLGLADAPTLARFVDGTVFILEANRVPFSQARTSVKRLQSMGGTVMGMVLTKYQAEKAGYGYGYDYYEYKSA
ncbi:MAG: polysaccharide biosynthesis tyrosine autokinase, partial [Litoreibacter sp.]